MQVNGQLHASVALTPKKQITNNIKSLAKIRPKSRAEKGCSEERLSKYMFRSCF
jgi:hypothetical protein